MKRFTLIFLMVVFAGASASMAQDFPDEIRRDSTSRPAFGEEPLENIELANRLNFCRQLMRSRSFEDAAAMLERLYEDKPDSPVIVGLLVQCYDQLQHYEKSEAMIERYLSRDPEAFSFRLAYAEVIAKQGDFGRARQAYLDAASQFPLTNTIRYQAVVQSMVTHEMGDDALLLIDSLRGRTFDSSLFAIQRGTVLEKQRRYGEAAREFYSLLDDTSRVGNDAEKRLAALLDFGESQPAVESVFVAHDDLLQTPRALKILSSHYLKSGRYDKAFEFSAGRDSLGESGGDAMLAFMQSCFERNLYDQTARAGEYLLTHYDTADIPNAAYVAYGRALAELNRADEAVEVYQRILALTKRGRDKAEVLYLIGKLFLDNLGKYDLALTYFDSVETHYGGYPAYQQALVARPHCYLRQGDLERAGAEFEKVLTRRLGQNLKEEVLYYAALVDFFQKQFDSTRGHLERLLVDHPAGRYVNDAVRLLFTIDEAAGHPDILYDYSAALLFEERRMTDSAVAKLGAISEAPDGILGDLAFFELARLSLAEGDGEAAIAYVDRLAESFPESYYLPYGLKTKADIFSSDPLRNEEARDIYRHLLESYPNFPFLSAIRQKLRQLDELYGSS